jgi:hypothetical protein
MSSRGFGSSHRSYRHQEGSLFLQPLPGSIPIRPQPSVRSSHQRSPSPSRFPRFEESSVNEKSRSDSVAQTSSTKAETSATRSTPDLLSFHHQSRPSSSASLRHLIYHQGSASPDYSLSPIPDTDIASSQFALPLPSLHSGYLHPPRKIRLWSILKPWLPVLAYLSTSLGFLVAIAFWKTQLFEGTLLNPCNPRLRYYLRPIHSTSIGKCRPLTSICLRLQVWTTCRAGSRPTKILAMVFSFSSSSSQHFVSDCRSNIRN